MNSNSTNPLMNKNQREENKMEIFMGLILPIAVVVITYCSKKYEQKRQQQMHEEVIKRAALELVEYVKKSLPSG